MAISPDGRTLYPTLEGPWRDDPLTRRMYQFDIRSRHYVATRRTYHMEDPTFLLSDLTALDAPPLRRARARQHDGRHDGPQAGLVIDLRRTDAAGALVKRQVLDLEHLRDPALISLPARPGDVGLGDPFAMPYVTIEAVLPLRRSRGHRQRHELRLDRRNPALPDYSDFIVVSVPGLAPAAAGSARGGVPSSAWPCSPLPSSPGIVATSHSAQAAVGPAGRTAWLWRVRHRLLAVADRIAGWPSLIPVTVG